MVVTRIWREPRADSTATIAAAAPVTMDQLSLVDLAYLFEFLTATDLAHVTRTCRALQPRESAVKTAIGLLIKHRFGDVLGFLREDEQHWPRSPLIVRCAEMLHVKTVLNSAVLSAEDGQTKGYYVSKAWTLAWKKRCQGYEQYLHQFKITKRKQQQNDKRKQHPRRMASSSSGGSTSRFVDSEKIATREASALIVCEHDALLPAAFCVARSKRVLVSRNTYRLLSLYAPDVRGFDAYRTPDCMDCVLAKAEDDREVERRKQDRFEEAISGSSELVDVLLRKNGYPNELFSPVSAPGNTMLSLSHTSSHTYYLVPKKWLIKWRKYVRSMADDVPGPILNSELVCQTHQRSVVPAYITMFLSGFSLEVSLQATQALGASASTQYEIVTSSEWDVLFHRYCAEYAVGFDIHSGSYHWRTPECNVCHYGMGPARRDRRNGAKA